MEEKKNKYVRGGKYLYFRGRKTKKEKQENIGRWDIFFCGGEGTGGTYLKKENIFFVEE